MPNYKISVSKDSKRYSIIFKADNEAIARDRVHKEWYSILGIEEINNKENFWNTFIFEAFKWWERKHWKIVWDDIFKVYVNLVKNLEYDVFSIYPEWNEISSEEKEKILKELKEEYNLFFKWWKKDKIDEIREKIKKEKWEKLNLDQFYLKKELEETNKLINHVLKKLESMILWNSILKLDIEQKQKLENIYNSIIKLKKSTNISKLREVWEAALQKIWNLELKVLEETKDEKNRELLKETNKLLKEIWSKDRFIEKDRDISYQFKQFIAYIKDFFKSVKKEDNNKDFIDKETHSYVRTQLYLNKYEEKLREHRIYYWKNFFSLMTNKEKKDMYDIKTSVIKQNIFLLKLKLDWKIFSYSFIIKWLWWFLIWFWDFIDILRKVIFYIIFIYSLMFLLFFNIRSNFYDNWSYNFFWVYFLIILIISYIFMSFPKKIIFIIWNFALFVFIIILWVINF